MPLTPKEAFSYAEGVNFDYGPSFLADPEAIVRAKFGDRASVIYGTDFKGLFGQERVPYGVRIRPIGSEAPRYSFRGTLTLKEWAEDLWSFPSRCPFSVGLMHEGFRDLYATLVVDGKSLVVDAQAWGASRPFVDGHSLGAALATVFAANLGSRCDRLLTFEGPRVGDAEFCASMDLLVRDHTRIVVIGDVVPHVPPERLGYRHAGEAVELDAAKLDHPLLPVERLKFLHSLDTVLRLLADEAVAA